MDANKERMIYRCPECFAKDIDVILLFDEKDKEFYCVKCCFTGKRENIEEQYRFFRKSKYKTLKSIQ